jgi:hypothetical protein
MRKPTFQLLLGKLRNVGLKDGRKVSAGEKLMTFISILKGSSNREGAERWQHSGSTISSIVRQCITAFIRIKNEYIVLPNVDTPSMDDIINNPKFFPYFANCDGMLDGSHVHAVPPAKNRDAFRNRKGFLSQNVLVVCNTKLEIIYILPGWEGSAHDSKVLDDAYNKGLCAIPGRFKLGDAGYGLTFSVLTPYRGVRYHLKEWKRGRERPQTMFELFNLRHSQLRNAIERCFGILKKRFPILVHMCSYPFNIQVLLVYCCAIIHNFIRRHQSIPDEFDELDEEEDNSPSEAEMDEARARAVPQDVVEWRDNIARMMWDDYRAYLTRRRNQN